jgi:hypothetical protein
MGDFGGNYLIIRKSKEKRFIALKIGSKQVKCVEELIQTALPVIIFEVKNKSTYCLLFNRNVSLDKYL